LPLPNRRVSCNFILLAELLHIHEVGEKALSLLSGAVDNFHLVPFSSAAHDAQRNIAQAKKHVHVLVYSREVQIGSVNNVRLCCPIQTGL